MSQEKIEQEAKEKISIKSNRLLESELKSKRNPQWYIDLIKSELEKRKLK